MNLEDWRNKVDQTFDQIGKDIKSAKNLWGVDEWSGSTPTVPVPTNVQVTNITDTSATVTWGEVVGNTDPSTPTGLAVSNITENSATVSWSASND